ncbi:MAG: phosphomannomutase [Phycisphaerae bacterium]|nr:MAG: phosphomannomutase [Phycisphaerae bacterium]
MLSISGCRGILGETMTPDVAARFAAAFGGYVIERTGPGAGLVIGRDGRRGSAEIQAAAMRGLASVGCRVVDVGVAMTPSVAVMVDEVRRRAKHTPGVGGSPSPDPRSHLGGGVVITASHNPQEWCGLKCLLAEGGEYGSAACAPSAEIAREIIARFEQREGITACDANAEPEGSANYAHIERVVRAMQDAGLSDEPEILAEGLQVALDSVNASGVEGGREFLETLGCAELLHIGGETSGVFPHPPEPTRENLSLPGGLCEAVRESGSAVGFAQDPDADRLAIVDERGVYIGEEYTLALSAMALLDGAPAHSQSGMRARERVLVTNLSTSRMLDDVAARYGARVVRTPVGEAHVVAAMKRLAAEGFDVVCGGEGNGGLIWPRVTYVRDSLSAMALVLWLMSPAGGGQGRRRTVSDLVKSIPAYAIEKRKVDLARREDATPVLERLAAAYGTHRVDRQDGVWVDFTSGPHKGKAWLHVRASNTEPIMRLIAEAPTPRAANEVLDEAARVARG